MIAKRTLLQALQRGARPAYRAAFSTPAFHLQRPTVVVARPFFFNATPARNFATSPEDLKEKIMVQLGFLTDEKGTSITQMDLVSSVDITPSPADESKFEVTIKLNLTQDFRKAKSLITKQLLETAPPSLRAIVDKVKVKMAPQERQMGEQPETKHKMTPSRLAGMKGVKNIIAVSSCKGGVGKSTVAVNFAFSLQKHGYKVGLFDADMYGPSLPTMINPDSPYLYQDEADASMISPVEFSNMKCMSYGFATKGQTAVMRGPMVSNLVVQLIGQTNWGELDFLVIDFPPGTGDIQLTLSQELNLSGAVIVTTPQKLSYVDVVKGIEMFDSLKVPTVALVENMSYFKCDSCDTKHRIFGEGYNSEIQSSYGIQNTFEVPIEKDIAQMGDSGTPFVLTLPDGVEIVQTYSDLASCVAKEIQYSLSGKAHLFDVKYDPRVGKVIFSYPEFEEAADAPVGGEAAVQENIRVFKKEIDPYDLRINCICAACVDEVDGRQILEVDKVPKDVFPTNIIRKGNYAVAMVWSDGHRSSIYPFDRLKEEKIPGEVSEVQVSGE